jgi:cellulose synthase operon protein C
MTAKTIRRFAILVAIVGLAGGAAIGVQQYQLAKMAHSVITKAQLAEENGNLVEAGRLYQQHLAVIEGDTETRIKYADVLSKSDNLLEQKDARVLYTEVLKRSGGLRDVRRKLMDLKLKMNDFRAAREDVEILLDAAKSDVAQQTHDGTQTQRDKARGELHFLMGKCREAGGEEAAAESSYQDAIKFAPQQLEAYQQLANLLRKKPGKEKEADELIEKMVSSDRENYKVYLERGRYYARQAVSEVDPRRSQLLDRARADLQEAARRSRSATEVILEQAKVATVATAGKPGRSSARRILENGLKDAPKSGELYGALADLELQDGQAEKAIATLEDGLKGQPDSMKLQLHVMLAEILAQHGDTGKLLLHIEELKKLGCSVAYTQYLMSYYYVNKSQYQKARQLLIPLLAETGSRSILAVPINLLLARCYSELGETQMQQDAYGRALISNSGDVKAKLGYINTQIQQGDFDGAIEGYREILDRVPQARLALASLLIARNRQRLAAKQDWVEVERLVDEAAKAAPESAGPVILRADMVLARDRSKVTEARAIVHEARQRLPKSVELWNCEARIISELWDPQANPVGRQRKVDEALAFLKEGERQLGDSVELRLQRARMWAAKTGPEVASALTELAQNIEVFSKSDRRRLLDGLAGELVRPQIQNFNEASRLWSRLTEDDPDDIGLRRKLVDLALQIGNEDEIKKNIAEIARIEGDQGIQSRYWQVRYLIWQIDRVNDPKIRQELRTKARASLTELRARRSDWSLIPLLFASLDEQELNQGELDEKQKQEKRQAIANSYIEAINLGERGSVVVRRVVELLFAQGKAKEALNLFNRIPVESQLAGDLGRRVAQVAIDYQDFQGAEEIARKTVAANPGRLQDRLALAQILRARGNQAAAEQELEDFVALGKDDPDRWIALVWWYVVTKEPAKAQQAVQEAEKNLPPANAPTALAQSYKLLGDYGADDETAKAKWYTEAEKWYQKDWDAKHDLPATRRLVDFFIETKQFEKAASRLRTIQQQSDGKNSDLVVWARRMLALTLASGTDPERLKEALVLVERPNQVGQPNVKAMEDPEDLRVLARVLDAQKTPEHRQRAIKVLQSLVTQGLATSDDRFLLAQLTEASGDWSKARELYHGLIARTDSVRDLETLNRWPSYLSHFAKALLRHHQAGNDQDLAEVQDLIAKLKRLQPNSLEVLALEVERCRLQNQVDRATELIDNFAKRPGLTPLAYGMLAEMAAKLGRLELAERLYREIVSRWPNLPQGTMVLADFLGRRGQVKEALDLCEQLWPNTKEPELLAKLSLRAVFTANGFKISKSADDAQVLRVVSWLERALRKKPKSTILLLSLGNLREQQGLYAEAEEAYKQAITNGDRGGISHNNLAWLMTLKDGKAAAALEYVNQAIRLQGPNADFLDTRGIVYLAVGDKQRAIADLENAVAGDPARSPVKLFHLAQAYLEVHDREKAKRTFTEAKTKGLVPDTLHRLEEPVYRRVVSELGMK